MFGPETTIALAIQSRIDKIEQQVEELVEVQKSTLQHLREIIMIVTEISEESSEE